MDATEKHIDEAAARGDGGHGDGPPEEVAEETGQTSGESSVRGPEPEGQEQTHGAIPGQQPARPPEETGKPAAEEYEPDFEDEADAVAQRDAGAQQQTADARAHDGGAGGEGGGGQRAVAKEVTWEEELSKTREVSTAARDASGGASASGDREVQNPHPSPAMAQKPKASKSMRNHMKGTLTSFRQAARTSEYDPNQTGILLQKVRSRQHDPLGLHANLDHC